MVCGFFIFMANFFIMKYKLFNKNLYKFGAGAAFVFSLTSCGSNPSGKDGAGATAATQEQKDYGKKLQTAAFDLIGAVNALGSVNYGTEWYDKIKGYEHLTGYANTLEDTDQDGAWYLADLLVGSIGSICEQEKAGDHGIKKHAGKQITQENSALCKFFDAKLVDMLKASKNTEIKDKGGVDIAVALVAVCQELMIMLIFIKCLVIDDGRPIGVDQHG